MPSLAKFGKVAGIALGAAAGLAGVGAFAALRRPLPSRSGTLTVPGLHTPVKVIRDSWGVPHIYADNAPDLFMAQGYVHAQDRLWQMELHRRIGHGRLAEIFGAIAVDSDRLLRVLGLGRAARREAELLDGELHMAINAYVRGVNAYLARHASRLPIEFTILRLRPQPWAPADVLVWSKVMALNLSRNWILEALRARIVATVGIERAQMLEPAYAADHPLTIPAGAHYRPDLAADALGLTAAAAPFIGPSDSGQGSNSWVVGGARTASGRPILANDPHLEIQIPSLWYENHLSGGDYHVTGVSIPGSPGVVIGHNERIAWGATNGENDVQDLYIERFDQLDPTRYEFRGEWLRADVAREEITVRGQHAPVVEEVRITRHGPIITPLIRAANQQNTTTAPATASDGEALALRWTALEPGRVIDAILAINRAHDWESFRTALADWDVPTTNFTYADVEGHIGYTLAGRLPMRAQGDGRLPAPGWTGEHEWNGYIPPADLPHVLDPDESFVVTANNRITGPDYAHPLPSEWLSGYRAARIRELIEQTPHHDAASFARMHSDVRSLPGIELAALTERLPAMHVTAQHARNVLAAWDGELKPESAGATIYARLREKLLTTAYAEITEPLGMITGQGMFATWPGRGYLLRALPQLIRRLTAREEGWLPPGRTWDDVLSTAWEAAIAELRTEFGDDVQTWRYGRFHTLKLRHPLGAIPALARIFNRGPFPTGGDNDTVHMGYLPREFAGSPYYIGPSYRQICDTSDWDRSRSMHATGQSGQPGSRHYTDFIQPWLNVEYHPMLWTRARVEQAAASRLTLAPASANGREDV